MRRTAKLLMGLTALALLAVPSTSVLAFDIAIQGTTMDVPNSAPYNGTCVIRERIWTTNACNTGSINPATCPTTGNGSCATGHEDNCVPAGGANCGTCPRSFISNVQASGRAGYQSHTEHEA